MIKILLPIALITYLFTSLAIAAVTPITSTIDVKSEAMVISINRHIHWGEISKPTVTSTCTMSTDATVSGSSYCGVGGTPNYGEITVNGNRNASIQITSSTATVDGIAFTPEFSADDITVTESLTTSLDDSGSAQVKVIGKIQLTPNLMITGGTTTIYATISVTYN